MVSATQITAVAPSNAAGQVSVSVTASGGTSNSVSYFYIAAPTIAALSPNQGPTAGANSVSITGTNLTSATSVQFGASSAAFTVVSDTQLTATAPAGSGSVNVTVTTPGGTSNSASYTYVAAPSITSISPVPPQGPLSGGNTVTLTGTRLSGATSVRFGANSAAFTVISDTQVTAIVPPGGGVVNVNVTTPGGTSNSLTYAYVAAPSITSTSPNQGPMAGGNAVTLTGTGFTGATVVQFGAKPAVSYTVVSGTQITAVAPSGTPGPVLISVTRPGGTSNSVPYFYVAVPMITSISTPQGPTAGGTTVALTGSGFSGATAVNFGTSSAAFAVVSDSQLTATAPAGSGTVNVNVTTLGGTSNSVMYSYVAPPSITSLSPQQGPATGGNTVTITGTNLTFTSTVNFGLNQASFAAFSDTQLTTTVPAGAAGLVPVTVTTVGGTSNSGTYTYVYPPGS